MKFRSFYLVVLLSFTLVCLPVTSYSEYDISRVAPILDSAETFFTLLNKQEYSAAWELLSEKTHRVIIEDVYKSYNKMGGTIKKEDVRNDFNSRGNMFDSYWHAFVDNFDSDMILNDSRWEVGFIKEQEAEIIIRYKKASNPAKLKLFRENSIWKVGLTETFWSRNSLY